jgi:hypothetical protein
MKRLLSYISLALTVTVLSCNKEALNKGPLNLYSDNNVWKDSALISRVVLQTYSGIHSVYDDAGNWLICDITDEAKSARSFLDCNLINSGQYSPSTNIYEDLWKDAYTNIRACNTVLLHLDEMPLSNGGKQQIKGEMLFIRALTYEDLFFTFGRFPIINKVLTLEDDLSVRRGPGICIGQGYQICSAGIEVQVIA